MREIKFVIGGIIFLVIIYTLSYWFVVGNLNFSDMTKSDRFSFIYGFYVFGIIGGLLGKIIELNME